MKPFGWSYLLDMYRCRRGVCDDLELHYRFLEELVVRLNMIPMTTPYVVHAPTEFVVAQSLDALPAFTRKERFPDKAGVSGWIGLVTSGIQIHSCEPTRFATIDVYSCNQFDKEAIKKHCREVFEFEEFEEHWIERGARYGDQAISI